MVAVGRELSPALRPNGHTLLICVYRDKTQVWSWGLGHSSHVLGEKVALGFFFLCSLRQGGVQRRHRTAANTGML